MAIIINFDGACDPQNPGGIGVWAWVAKRDGKVIAQKFGVEAEDPANTNSRFEYMAIIRAISWIWNANLKEEEVEFFGDSQLVIRQLSGVYAVKSPNIIPLHAQAKRGLKGLREYALTWVMREENEEADALTKEGYRLHVLNHGKNCIGYGRSPRRS